MDHNSMSYGTVALKGRLLLATIEPPRTIRAILLNCNGSTVGGIRGST
jgi:hypothetical protein